MAGPPNHHHSRSKRRLFRRMFHLAVALMLCFGAAYLGSRVTMPNIPGWYEKLAKPSFNPPNWIFAPVWTTLYAMMALALWIIWKQGIDFWKVRVATVLFLVQLAINVLWSYAFFGMRWPLAGLIVVSLLWVFVAWTIIAFLRLDKRAGWMMIPYLAWISFALILNAAIVRLN